jgi:hypothetical protein
MRSVKEEDFFAPCLKISGKARVLQMVALFIAIIVSLCFLLVYVTVASGPGPLLGGPSQPMGKLVVILVLTAAQILALIPCWRCWMLRRWACGVGLAIFWPIAVVSVFANANLALMLFAFLLPVTQIVREEWPSLQSDF